MTPFGQLRRLDQTALMRHFSSEAPHRDAHLAGLVGTILDEAVSSGNVMMPIGRVSSMMSLRLKGAVRPDRSHVSPAALSVKLWLDDLRLVAFGFVAVGSRSCVRRRDISRGNRLF